MVKIEHKRVLIWSGWARLSHAAITVATFTLLLTGLLIAESPSLAETASEIHYLSASILVFGIMVRLVLMFFSQQHERLSNLFPASNELSAMVQTLRFYFSFGKLQMPHWYAHNPLWKPVYLVVYIALLVMIITGYLMADTDLLFGFYVPSVHTFWAEFLLWFSCLHIVAVILHDYRNGTTDISAMVNGYRLFLYERQEGSVDDEAIQVVNLDSLKK